MLQEIINLYTECKHLDNIKVQKNEIQQKIDKIITEKNQLHQDIKFEIQISENRIMEINQEIKNYRKEVKVQKFKYKNYLILQIEKDCLVSAENTKESTIEKLFQSISGYDELELYEDEHHFYFSLKSDNKLLEMYNFFDITELNKSKAIFNLKTKFCRVLYNLILTKSEIDIFSNKFQKNVNKFNNFFTSTAYFKTNLIELEIKIVLKNLKDLISIRKSSILEENSNVVVSTDAIKLLKILQKLKQYENHNELIQINSLQAIKNFFNKNRTNSLRERILAFSDACFIFKNYDQEYFDGNDIKEKVLGNIFEIIDFSFADDDFSTVVSQLISSFDDIVDQICKDHWNNSLKSILRDKFYQFFIDYILSFKEIKEYDAYDLTKIAESLVNLGVNRLENFSKLFITRNKKDVDITDEDFEMIISKLVY